MLSPSLIAKRLRSFGCVFAEEEARLLIASARTPAHLSAMVDRRIAGFPVEHVLGWAEFCGLRIAVDPGVFVPRRRTEFLARVAAEVVGRISPPSEAVVVDLCCGSGAIGAAILASIGPVRLHSVDSEHAAAKCARRNLGALGRVYEGDLYDALPDALLGKVDVLVVNPPYVPTDAIPVLPREARLHEPLVALDGGADGLEVLRRVINPATLWLKPGGCLLVEASKSQGPQVAGLMAHRGLLPRLAGDDDLDATVVLGRECFQASRKEGTSDGKSNPDPRAGRHLKPPLG